MVSRTCQSTLSDLSRAVVLAVSIHLRFLVHLAPSYSLTFQTQWHHRDTISLNFWDYVWYLPPTRKVKVNDPKVGYRRGISKMKLDNFYCLEYSKYWPFFHGGACGVMVIVVGNGLGNTSSIAGRDWLHFT